jgi:hypothetical protein
MRARLLPLLACGLFCAQAIAQSNGVRFIFPEFTKVYAGKGMWSSYQLGMGYDHDFNDRISMGLDATLDLQRATEDGNDISVQYAGYTADYQVADKLFSLTYRTAYSFSDNSETHLYIGSFIGYRSFKQVLALGYVDNTTGTVVGNGPFVQNAEGAKALFPVGLRLGVRGSLEGGFADLYTQLGYTIGGGESAFTQSYFSGEEFDLSSMSFTLGLAYGFGW